MTKTEANVLLAAIVGTVAETGEAPEGILYAGLMSRLSLDQFNGLLSLLKQSGILESSSMHCVKITPKGKELASKIDAFRKAAS